MNKNKRVVVVGAGPGGLSAAMLLVSKGYQVMVYEKEAHVGGRNGPIDLEGFVFDTGPTFLMMKFVLDNLFTSAGRDINTYLSFTKLDPMYRLLFKDKSLMVSSNTAKMKEEIEKYFPGESGGLDRFKEYEKKRFDKLYPCLGRDYGSLSCYASADLLKALPYLSLGNSVFEELGKYFTSEDLKIVFTFQAKYLGMSAWKCPALFTMLPFVEQDQGIYHVTGGLHKISEAMASVIQEYGGKIELNTEVDDVLVKDGKAVGIRLKDGRIQEADAVMINADFAHAMNTLFQPGQLKKFTPEKLDSMLYSCSTFMMYLGLDKLYAEVPHHNIVFARDYHQNVTEIFETKELSADISLYVHNASVTDSSLAPAGKSSVYILVPVPNNISGIDWDKHKESFRELVLSTLEQRTEMKDIRQHIETEKITTPADWARSKDVYNGATFNLSHNLGQMMYFRPHNRFEEFKNCYIVGGGTHPGSGLPTIYESANISAGLLQEDLESL